MFPLPRLDNKSLLRAATFFSLIFLLFCPGDVFVCIYTAHHLSSYSRPVKQTPSIKIDSVDLTGHANSILITTIYRIKMDMTTGPINPHGNWRRSWFGLSWVK